MKRAVSVWVLAMVTVCAATTARAQPVPFAKGDVFASIGFGFVVVYGGDGTVKQALDTGVNTEQTVGSAFDAAGNFYVANWLGGQVFKFDPRGLLQGSFVTGGTGPESIVFDAAGNMYVGHGLPPANQIQKFTAAGSPLATFTPVVEGRGTNWVELAADQTILFYTSESQAVKRFDVVGNAQLADFANLGAGPAFALRLLPDGGLIVADSLDIKRLDSRGAIIQTYDVAVPPHDTWFSVNLDPNGTSFWSADVLTGLIEKFDIASGALLQTINTGFPNTLGGVAVFAEPVQSIAPPPPPKPAVTVLVTSAFAQFVGASAFTATLTAGGAPVPGVTITFFFKGSPVGTAVTDANGVATLAERARGDLGLHVGQIGATFAGNAAFAPASAIGDLLITKGTKGR